MRMFDQRCGVEKGKFSFIFVRVVVWSGWSCDLGRNKRIAIFGFEKTMTSKRKDDHKPKVGDVVDGKWEIAIKLGEGGFGYKVSHVETKEKYAMKVEPINTGQHLKMEAAVLKSFEISRMAYPHVCRYVESGYSKKYAFLIMQLVGQNLDDLRRSCPDNKFGGSTTVRLGMQCFEAVESLHGIGYLHRDIKPANFAMGRTAEQNRNVYLLDFGRARPYVTEDGHLRLPREKRKEFVGTVRYASINALRQKEVGRHDDLWSLFYMLVEFQMGQ